MPHDPVRVADTGAWLAKAREDIRAAGVDLAASPPLRADAAFHCQQAVEKALKAFLTWHDQPFRKTHSLLELGVQCGELDKTLEPLLRRAAALSEYAWRYRYPGDASEPTAETVASALALATEVAQAVSRLTADR